MSEVIYENYIGLINFTWNMMYWLGSSLYFWFSMKVPNIVISEYALLLCDIHSKLAFSTHFYALFKKCMGKWSRFRFFDITVFETLVKNLKYNGRFGRFVNNFILHFTTKPEVKCLCFCIRWTSRAFCHFRVWCIVYSKL